VGIGLLEAAGMRRKARRRGGVGPPQDTDEAGCVGYNEESMTTEERFERIEHVTAGLAEERRKDREEFRALWRDTQRQLNELTIRVAEVNDRLSARIGELAEHAAVRDRETDRRFRETDARMDKLVGAIGEWMTRQPNAR
jgi:hypothetical protein